ncbi:ABC transporter substrate-binding protein [Agarivorans sp. 3_MG-2023]|uniref:ABC transporter substrate-binding protein n=1 Tax=Agarivorans sp. 3_MG-2023 TaxID=3062648 RepID=UPI0026E24B9B|nr:ABC transporter substrate-binding protein [Agarivorans sp. 3_MG-2023]MDO6687876.1 ABC transporter substrate-binding protein [Agarivorans sp. 3_MG-2023]MDO6717498.1 ABC transporter substrate-binding protein [Agarivorans sp. 2_MG-2023]
MVILLLVFCPLVWGQGSVVFLNPGKADESFWQDVDTFAAVAAKQLDLDLQTFHSERNHYSKLKHIEWMIENQQLPDYLMLVNERQALPRMLSLLEGHAVYVVVILNDLDEDQLALRKLNPHWQKYLLSSLVPNNYAIGYATAQAMHAAAEGGGGDAVIISGDKATPASVAREGGAEAFFLQQTSINMRQIVYGQWDEQRSYYQTKVLLQRYPQLRFLWTANDHMAFGSLKAIKEAGKQAGKDIFVGTVNTSAKALELRETGEISALGGGHFSAAGLALNLIYLHQLGKPIPATVNSNMFQLLVPGTQEYQQLKDKNWSDISFDTLLLERDKSFNFPVVQ